MSSAYARAAAGFIVQRAMTLPGAMQKDRLVRMQRDMDAIANWQPCAAVPFGIAKSPTLTLPKIDRTTLAWWRNKEFA